MKEIKLDWEEFITRHEAKNIIPIVNPNKGHALMKTQFAPKNWRIKIKLLTWLSIIALIVGIVLFFFVKWWIPAIIIFFGIWLPRTIQKIGARAVIKTSLKNPEFYSHAILSETMKIYA